MDGHDLVPDIYITRVPVRNSNHVKAFVDKTLTYETEIPLQDFTEKMLLAGVKLWTLWDGKSDSHHRSELIFNNHIVSNWSGKKVNFFDTGTDFDEGPDYQVTAANLAAQLNEGYGMFHFAGHGNSRAIIMESGKDFSIIDAMELKNPFSGIMLSNACNVNAFDSIDPCLSEAFLRNPNGGCVAFFGSARYGFGNPDPSNTLGPSLKYNASFMKYLFQDDPKTDWNSFGGLTSLVKSDFSHNGSSGGIYLYLLYAINAMGDPELPVYKNLPFTFDNVRLYRMGNSLTINTGGVNNCRICLTSLDLDQGYKKVVEDVSYHTFENIPEAFQVTITGSNYVPYTYVSGFATGITGDLSPHIKVFPNPFQEFLRIHFDLPEGQLQIYDVNGRLLKDMEVSFGENRINMSGYADGIYILRFTTKRGISRFKVLKGAGF